MDTTSAPATNLDSILGSEPAPTAAPPVAVPNPELAPVIPPVSPDPNAGLLTPQPQPAPVAQPPAQPAPQQQDHRVPLSELLDQRHRYQAERVRAEAAERQNQQLMEALLRMQQPQQPQPQPIDPVAEPERWAAALREETRREVMAARQEAQAIREETSRQFLNERLNQSEASARAAARARGNEAIVDQARDAAMQAGLAQTFLQQPDPYGALVAWHQANQLAQTIGADPAAYEARIRQQERDRLMAELKQGRQPSNIPPSLTSATNSAAAPQHVASDKDFFNTMFGRRPPRQG